MVEEIATVAPFPRNDKGGRSLYLSMSHNLAADYADERRLLVCKIATVGTAVRYDTLPRYEEWGAIQRDED